MSNMKLMMVCSLGKNSRLKLMTQVSVNIIGKFYIYDLYI